MKKLFFLLLIVVFYNAEAQRKRYGSYGRFSQVDGFSFTLKGGTARFFGELKENSGGNFFYGVGINKGLTPHLNLKLDFETGQALKGEEVSFYNSRFSAEYFGVNVIPVLNVGRMIAEDSPINIGMYAGFGWMWFHSTAYDLSSGQVQRYTNDANSRRTEVFKKYGEGRGKTGVYYTKERNIPLGILLSYPIGNRVNLGLDFRINFVRTDKLDATSGKDRSTLSTGANKIWGQLSYSDTPNDKWGYMGLNISYKFLSNRTDYQRGI